MSDVGENCHKSGLYIYFVAYLYIQNNPLGSL